MQYIIEDSRRVTVVETLEEALKRGVKKTICPTEPPVPGTTFGISSSRHLKKNGKDNSQKHCWNPNK